LANKLAIIKDAANDARVGNHKAAYAYWLGVGYPFLKDPSQTDLYNWGFANYSAGNYKTADSIFCGIYETKYPQEVFGYFWCMRSKTAEDDSTGSQGLAVDANVKFADIARAFDSTARVAGTKDSVRWKNQILNSYFALAQYYNDIKKDKETAVVYLKKVLEVDPTNPNAPKFIEILTRKPKPAASPAKKATGK
jgi:tetratricopeptide (TPR) repeat protein